MLQLQKKIQRKRIWLVLLLTLSQGCSPSPKKKGEAKKPDPSLIDPSSITIDRTDEATHAVLRFQSRSDVHCEIATAKQEPGGNAPSGFDKKATCNTAAGQRDFAEVISDLEASQLYHFQITVWPLTGDRTSAEVILVKETSAGTNGSNANGRYGDLLVARVNIPLRSAELHRHILPSQLSSEEIAKKIPLDSECTLSPEPEPTIYAGADQNLGVSNISTRGFASAIATPHGLQPGRMQLSFNALQFSSPDWEWTYSDSKGQSQLLRTRTPARFTSVEVKNGATPTRLSEANLGEEPDLSVDTSRGLTITWQAENLTPDARVLARIGREGTVQTMACAFRADAGQGEVPQALLQKIGWKTNERLISLFQLESTQFIPAKGWMIRSFDWRSARLLRTL